MSGVDSRREKLSRSKDPKRYIPRRCPITITIYKIDDATQPHTQKMHSRIQTYLIAGKDKSPNIHGRHQTICQKWKRIGNSDTRSQNIQSGHRNGIWLRKCAMLVIKSGKRHFTDEMELPNQDKIRTFGEKETYKYLWILEADTMKQE